MQTRCIVFTAYFRGNPSAVYTPQAGDYVLCADGGYALAAKMGIKPALIIGDCDSGVDLPEELLQRVPVEKDDTDTMLCVKKALAHGCSSILLLGGIGGRLDHTIANIQTLAFAEENGVAAEMRDEYETVFLLKNKKIRLDAQKGMRFSVFAYSSGCSGVGESGTQYPLHDAVLTNSFPLGVSNRITEEHAEISIKDGTLLVIINNSATN